MKLLRHFGLAGVLVAGLFCILPGQARAEARVRKIPQQALAFFIMNGRGAAPSFFVDGTKGERFEVVMGANAYAGPFVRDRGDDLVMYRDVPADPVSGRELSEQEAAVPTTPRVMKRKTLHKVQLPADAANLLLLVQCSGANIERVKVIDQSESKLPVGRVAVWNLTPDRVALRIGESQLMLEPGNMDTMRISTPNGKASDLTYQTALVRDGAWVTSLFSSVALNPKKRRTIFLVPAEGAQPRLQTFPNALPDPAPREEPI